MSMHKSFAVHAIRQSEDQGATYIPQLDGMPDSDVKLVHAALAAQSDKTFRGMCGTWYEGVSVAGAKHPRWTVLIPA